MTLYFQALEEEGHDPNTIEVEVTDSPAGKKTPGSARKAQLKAKADGNLLTSCFKFILKQLQY